MFFMQKYGKLFLVSLLFLLSAPVALCVKRWPADLGVLGSSLPRGEIFSFVNKVLLHTAFHSHQHIILI